ncbi:MAG: LLM class F420-dependent oxidoreductase [Microthrixaceae bacterium]
MRFNLTHPMVQHPYHPELASGRGVAALAGAAEAAGFDGYGFTDHPAPTQRWLDAGGHDALDPFVALGFVAAATSTIRLIPNIVVLPYRNPFVVAKAAATLDVLSGGRFTLAVGVGYLAEEFAALGVDHSERAALLDEALDVLRAVWTTDELDWEGRHFSAKGVTAHPRPVSTPHPPIWVGGNSGAARRRVAANGDGWCPFPAPRGLARVVGTAALDGGESLEFAIADLHRRLEEAGRDPTTVDVAFSCAAGGAPSGDDFDAEAHLEGLAHLADLGVTWVQVGVPGDSPARATEAVARYGELVIAPLRTGA